MEFERFDLGFANDHVPYGVLKAPSLFLNGLLQVNLEKQISGIGFYFPCQHKIRFKGKYREDMQTACSFDTADDEKSFLAQGRDRSGISKSNIWC